ncbi:MULTISPECIES: heavy metal-binding domain-containing protein [Bacteroidota]|nr:MULTISPECIES: heavy metal-binding domain-containing protein [Bacteroidota]
MNTQHQSSSENIFICPMHPEVKGNKGDKCSKCGMNLVPENKGTAKHFDVIISSEPEVIEAGKSTQFKIIVKNEDKVVSLEEVHEMKMHLLVVNEELTWFDHIHPIEQEDGSYLIDEIFPTAGDYLFFVDYKPENEEGNVYKHSLNVVGNTTEIAQLDTNAKFESESDGYTARILNGADLKTNTSQPLQFEILKDGNKINDDELQNYLGAKAHIVMISQAEKEFLHIHPMSNESYQIYAETLIKKPGLYRMWMQFKISNKVHTVDFTVHVAEGNKTSEGHNHHHKH